MSRDASSVMDILQACREIQGLTRGMSEDDFLADQRTHYAVLYLFAVIGEAVFRLSDEFKDQHTEISWREIRGMRNVLVYNYEGVNLKKTWEAINLDLPELQRALSDDMPGSA